MQELLTRAVTAASEAGAIIMAHYASTEFDTKADGSPVTHADIAANTFIVNALQETHIPILSEETLLLSAPYPDQLWIVDPLDGTRGFINKTGDFAVMIGLIQSGRPTLGVVYTPVSQTLYYASRGSGAWKRTVHGDTSLHVGNNIQNLRYIRSINHCSPEMQRLSNTLEATPIPLGSIGMKAGLLCEDGGDFFASWGAFGAWDVCATEILVLEAGGKVTDTRGEQLFYGTNDHLVEHGIVYSNTHCHEAVLTAIKTVTPNKTIA